MDQEPLDKNDPSHHEGNKEDQRCDKSNKSFPLPFSFHQRTVENEDISADDDAEGKEFVAVCEVNVEEHNVADLHMLQHHGHVLVAGLRRA